MVIAKVGGKSMIFRVNFPCEGNPPYPPYGSSMSVYEAKSWRSRPALNIGALIRVGWFAVAKIYTE